MTASFNSKAFKIILKENLSPDGTNWFFRVKNLPNLNLQSQRQTKDKASEEASDGQKFPIFFISVTHKAMTLSVENQSINRVLASSVKANKPDEVVAISFANFRFPEQVPKITTNYIENLLTKGICLNGRTYIFYGHSNSQLKSRTCYMLQTSNEDVVVRKINEFGDFSKFISVAKRAKRIGLLFSAAEASVRLDKKYTQDIDDIESSDGHIFTDGCGSISLDFAQELAKKRKIIFQNIRYCPSAFQIRYKGYKGMLMVNRDLGKNKLGATVVTGDLRPTASRIRVQLRSSMRKFKDCPDDSFSILDYAKPFSYACLNGELVTLLSCLGISDDILKKKQEDYFKFLEMAATEPQSAFKYLCYKAEFKAAEEVLLNGLTDVLVSKIKKLAREEWHGTYKNKDVGEGNERVRIMIPKSRILFGVCDYTGTLKEGECHVRITTESEGHLTIDGGHVIVGRNPCLHPGDIRKFLPVECKELSHIVDCIVFPTVGKRDPASLMSGGDLDGDKFFVSWDPDIIPARLFEPYGYPPAKETPSRNITYAAMIQYFARYNNSSLGRVKNLYLDWCRVDPKLGAGSKECQQLNTLFSSCVDGERIKIPEHLENPKIPKAGPGEKAQSLFILDILCENVKKMAKTIFRKETDALVLTSRDVLEALLSSPDMCNSSSRPSLLSEYELYCMVYHWCQRTQDGRIEEFINFFDFGAFTTPQKHAVLANLSPQMARGRSDCLRAQYIGPIFNALHQSEILTHEELCYANLHHHQVRWQKLYSSFDDGGHRLPSNLDAAFLNFDKKMLVFHVDNDLRVAIYIPKRIEKLTEVDVGDFQDLVKLFAFEALSGSRYKKNAVKGYRIYFDGEIVQLYEKRRPNTFIWFALNEAFAARNSMASNSEFKVSIALQKFDDRLSKTRGRVTKQESTGIEIYVISNRDRVGHQILENTMNEVTTTEVMRILQNTPKDYEIMAPTLDFQNLGEYCEKIVLHGNLELLGKLTTIKEFADIFTCCLDAGDGGNSRLFAILGKILTNFGTHFGPKFGDGLIRAILEVMAMGAPSLAILVVQNLLESSESPEGSRFPNFALPKGDGIRNFYFFALATALILSANQFRESSLNQFQHLFILMSRDESACFGFPEIIKIVKLICFTIRDFELAISFLQEVIDANEKQFNMPTTNPTSAPTSSPWSGTGRKVDPKTVTETEIWSPNGSSRKYFNHFIKALAFDYLAEVQENCTCDFWGLPLAAENQNDLQTTAPQKNHLEVHAKLKEFLPKSLTESDEPSGSDLSSASKTHAPEPHQKCLEISHSPEKPEIFETTLRTDIICKIRNEDHLRFCASKRPSNKSRQRSSVFDAIAVSVIRGKLEFRILQKPIPSELTSASWNVYLCGSTTNLSTMCTAIHNLITKEDEATNSISDLIEMSNSSPSPPESSRVEISLATHRNFNESQTIAVKTALNNSMTLIWGPPGAGKTTVVVEIILNFIRIFPHLRILVSASTHNAVDNVMERFLKEREKANGNSTSDDAIRLTSDISKVSANLKKWTLDAFVGANICNDDKAKGQAAKKVKEAAIVFSTCSGAGVGLLRLADDETSLWPAAEDPDGKKAKKKQKAEQKFDVVIVDEASQITEPNALIPIVKGSKYVILVGDHVQLRPTVKAEVAKEAGLETSLFERLYLSKASGNIRKVMLNMQYRMHPDLCKFPSEKFYDGKLLSGVSPKDRVMDISGFPWPLRVANKNEQLEGLVQPISPCVFLPCFSQECFGDHSKSNRGQAQVTIQVVKMLRTGENGQRHSINILSPYTKQVTLIKAGLRAGNLAGVEVNTIDGFQGREADIIIFCTVRANSSNSLGFLEDRRRLNVAITRARFGLILIGHEETLRSPGGIWKELLDYAKKVNLEVKAKAPAEKSEPKPTNSKENGAGSSHSGKGKNNK